MENYFHFTFLLFEGLTFGQGFGSMSENQKDMALLNANPGQFVVKYQVTIGIAVQKRMINTSFNPYQEKEELCQKVTLRLLEKTDEIKRQNDAVRGVVSHVFSFGKVN